MSVFSAIGATLTFAVGIMFSPLPIIAALVLLMGTNGVRKGIVFTLGWVVSVCALIGIAIALGSSFQDAQPTVFEGALQFILGLLFVWFAFSQLRTAYETRDHPTMPKWMSGLQSAGILTIFGAAFILNLTNVKNIPLAAQAVTAVRQLQDQIGAPLTTSQQWVTAIIFAVITALPMLIPTIMAAFGGDGAQRALSRASDFLVRYNHLAMAGLFLMMGTQAVGGGVQILAGHAA